MIAAVRTFRIETIRALNAEFIHAQTKHHVRPPTLTDIPDLERLANLVEEVGEVGKCFTYDTTDKDIKKELLQTACMALAYYEQLVTNEVQLRQELADGRERTNERTPAPRYRS